MPARAYSSRRSKKAFLAHFSVHGNVSKAAEVAGVHRTTIYDWQEHDDEFAAAFRQADIQATEELEAEARRRAVDGVEKHRRVYDSRGNLVDEYTEVTHSDTLLIFLLKARAPEKYRDRHDITSGGRPLQASHEDLDAAIERQLAHLALGSQGEAPVEAASTPEATHA